MLNKMYCVKEMWNGPLDGRFELKKQVHIHARVDLSFY